MSTKSFWFEQAFLSFYLYSLAVIVRIDSYFITITNNIPITNSGTVPTFSGGDAPVSISESLTVGSSVAVASLTDDLGESLIWSDLGSPYFEYNQTTGTLK